MKTGILMKMGPVLALLWIANEAAAQQTVRKGERVVLPCPVKVEAKNFAVSWSKDSGTGEKTDLNLSEGGSRIRLAEDKVSLVISMTMVADAGRYSCRVVLPQEPEMVDSVQLNVLAPPSAPQLFLQVPSNPKDGKWHLMCVTKGFYPERLTLRWTWKSTEAKATPESISCALKPTNHHADKFQTNAENSQPDIGSDTNITENHQLHHCLSGPDGLGPETQLTSLLSLPSRTSISADVKFTCSVEDHPGLDAILSASFDLESAPDEVIGCLNIVKIVFLSGVCVLILALEIAFLCERRLK